MSRKATPKIGEGAVLAIPLGDGRWVMSQVYRPGVSFFLLIFGATTDDLSDLSAITGRPVLGSWTNDAEVYRGNWKLLTHLPVPAGIFTEPEYAVLISGKPMVESFDGKSWRPREAGDMALLNRSTRSPLLVEGAVRAFFGLEDWLPTYEWMLLAPRTFAQ